MKSTAIALSSALLAVLPAFAEISFEQRNLIGHGFDRVVDETMIMVMATRNTSVMEYLQRHKIALR